MITVLRSCVLGALLLASACGGSSGVAGTPVVTAAAGPNFNSTFGGFMEITGGNPPASITLIGTGIGSDSTGASHATFTQTVVFATTPNQINNGKFAFNYADGSTLAGTYSGTATPPDSHGNTQGSGSFAVTTGSGRFSKAAGNTGTWTVTAQIAPQGSNPAGTISVNFVGTLTL